MFGHKRSTISPPPRLWETKEIELAPRSQRKNRFHDSPPQTDLPPIQALDTIGFESEFKEGKIDLVTFKLDDSPQNIAKAIAKVPKHEKRHIMATHTISSIGLGLGSTIGIMFRFTAPLAVGGAAFKIAIPFLIGMTAGAGVLAIGLAIFVHKFYTKEAIKNTGMLLNQIEHYEEKLAEKALSIEYKLHQSFAMLLRMQLALDKLKRARQASHPGSSSPSPMEQKIELRINNYINFLVNDPTHPHLQQIDDYEQRQNAIDRATARQDKIRIRLKEASFQILGGKTTPKEYLNNHIPEIRYCFPSLRLIAPKTKPPIIINKPAIGLAFLGTFSGTLGLSYLSITLISAFTVLPMAFPPLYVILGVALVVACYTAYSVYKTKQLEASRNTRLKDQQKQLAYYNRADSLLGARYTKELEKYSSYQADIMNQDNTPQKLAAPTPLVKSASNTRLSFLQSIGDANNSSPDIDQGRTSMLQSEDLSFRDPSQLTKKIT